MTRWRIGDRRLIDRRLIDRRIEQGGIEQGGIGDDRRRSVDCRPGPLSRG
jgi:hypothetical protein